MRLGVDFPPEWKIYSEKSQMALSDILYGYVLEQFMIRMSESSFGDYLWLTNENALGPEAYKKNGKERLHFYYAPAGRKILQEAPQAGHPLGHSVIRLLAKELFDRGWGELQWTYEMEECRRGFVFCMEGNYRSMRVPLVLTIEEAPENGQSPKRKEFSLLFSHQESCSYLSYSAESVLVEQIFEILGKLELISDMAPYDIMNEILQTQSINGRHIIEDLKVLTQKEPKIVSFKRLEQIMGYKNYGYMKKRWQQYEKRKGKTQEEWEEVIGRITKFLEPVWKALCENEIFFDDWMPELGRFLG